MKVGDQVRYREMIGRVVKLGGGRVLVELFAGASAGTARFRWVKERQLARDFTHFA